MILQLLILLLTLQAAPNMTVAWQKDTALLVTWHAPGYHCLWLDNQPIDCRNDSADLILRTGGIDAAYAPKPGQVLRLVDSAGNTNARVVVPTRVYRVILPIVVAP